MSKQPYIRAVADTSATAATPATVHVGPTASSAADDYRFAADVAHDLALATLDTMEGDAEATVRVLLLAAAYLRAGAEMPENVHSATTALLASLDEIAVRTPVIGGNEPAAVGSEDHPDGPLLLPVRKMKGTPLRVAGPHSVELARGWLAACKPQARHEGDDTPLAAA